MGIEGMELDQLAEESAREDYEIQLREEGARTVRDAMILLGRTGDMQPATNTLEGGPTPADVFADYQEWRGVTANTRKNERYRFERYLKDSTLFKTPIRLLDDAHAFEMLDQMQRDEVPHTPRKETAKTLSQMAKYFREKRLRSGALLFQSITVKKPRTTEDDFEKYLKLEDHLEYQTCPDISQDDKDLEGAGFLIGSRKSTLLHMPWSDVNLEEKWVIERYGLDGGATKSGKPHRKFLPPPAIALLRARHERYPNAELVFANPKTGKAYSRNWDGHFKANLVKAGIDRDLSFHSTRHGCACWLLSEGWSLEAVQDYLGHSSIAVTQRYAKMLPKEMKERAAQTGLTLVADSSDSRDDVTEAGENSGRLGKVALYR